MHRCACVCVAHAGGPREGGRGGRQGGGRGRTRHVRACTLHRGRCTQASWLSTCHTPRYGITRGGMPRRYGTTPVYVAPCHMHVCGGRGFPLPAMDRDRLTPAGAAKRFVCVCPPRVPAQGVRCPGASNTQPSISRSPPSHLTSAVGRSCSMPAAVTRRACACVGWSVLAGTAWRPLLNAARTDEATDEANGRRQVQSRPKHPKKVVDHHTGAAPPGRRWPFSRHSAGDRRPVRRQSPVGAARRTAAARPRGPL